MKIMQINTIKNVSEAHDIIERSDIGDYIIITNINELADRKVFADNVKAEINKIYGSIKADKPQNSPFHVDYKTHYPKETYYMDTDSIITTIPTKYYLISYAMHLYGYPKDWEYENNVIDCSPVDWLVNEVFTKIKHHVVKLINSIEITKQQYDNYKEAL